MYGILEQMRESGKVPKESVGISLLVCGDKEGSSTKILCQFTNSQVSHSMKTAKLLGIYQGSKESRENIKELNGLTSDNMTKFLQDS